MGTLSICFRVEIKYHSFSFGGYSQHMPNIWCFAYTICKQRQFRKANKRLTSSTLSADSGGKILVIFISSFPTRLDLKLHANSLLNVFFFFFFFFFVLYFPQQNLAVDATCLFRGQFTWNVMFHSGWKNKKIRHKFVVYCHA